MCQAPGSRNMVILQSEEHKENDNDDDDENDDNDDDGHDDDDDMNLSSNVECFICFVFGIRLWMVS